MLFGKPLYLKRKHAKRGGLGYGSLSDEDLPHTDPNAAASPEAGRPSEDSQAGGGHGHEMSHEEVTHGGHEGEVPTWLFS